MIARRGCRWWTSALQLRCTSSVAPPVAEPKCDREPSPLPLDTPLRPGLPPELLSALPVPFARGGRREIAVRHEGIVKVPDEVEAAIANVVHGADSTRKACALGTGV